MSKAQNSSQERTKYFKIPNYIWNLKLFLLIPRDNRILRQSMFYTLLKPPTECWARPRILPQVPDVIPPKIRFFVRSRSCIMRFRHVLLSALTNGPRHLLLRVNCECFFTAMTSMKNDVTFKKTLDFFIAFSGYRKSLNSPRHLKNDKLFSFLCRWERWVVELSLFLWYSML
jgi:hypothetical protein